MKYSDVERMMDAGLISSDQAREITSHFKLNEDDGSRFLRIVSVVGAVLVACGIVLLISANWEVIPRGVKVATGLVLMLGAHAAGWYLRENPGNHPKSGEALHLLGAALFLGNIALLGQVYHLSSRMPNAFLLWWMGIALLPWVLRSKVLHVLSLIAFSIWFGAELNERAGLFYFGHEGQILLYALLGMCFVGFGLLLRGTSFDSFSGITEKLGLLGLLTFTYPLAWRVFAEELSGRDPSWPLYVMLGLALLLMGTGVARCKQLTSQWRWAWGLSLGALAMLIAAAWHFAEGYDLRLQTLDPVLISWAATIMMFTYGVLQLHVGVQLGTKFMVNSGTLLIGGVMLSAYIELFGSMAETGMVFLVGGIFMIGLGIYLEKQRRTLVSRMKHITGETI
jgi:uncharacterized membrane protein